MDEFWKMHQGKHLQRIWFGSGTSAFITKSKHRPFSPSNLPHQGISDDLGAWIQNWLIHGRQWDGWKCIILTGGLRLVVIRTDLCWDLCFLWFLLITWTNLDGLICTFADDIKIGGVANSEEGCQRI